MRYRYNYSFVLFIVVLSLIVLGLTGSANAQVRLPQLISDGMVLQRDAKIKIWGWASPGEKLRIDFDRKHYKVTADAGGKWMVLMTPHQAGGPFIMEFKATNDLVLRDIWVGDVWFCSGQSNMVVNMERVKERYPEVIAGANFPEIRNFFIPTASDVRAVHDDLPPGSWQAADPQKVLNFGAASFFFARELYTKYHVPIGIINSSVGGTPVQAWISAQGLKDIPSYSARLARLKDTVYLNQLIHPAISRNNAEERNTSRRSSATMDKGLSGSKTWYDTSYIASGWHPFWLPGYWADQGIRGLNGVVWFRKEIDVPPSMVGKTARLFMGRIVDADIAYVNGVQVGAITYQYPPRRYVLPANLLRPGKNIIVVRVVNNSGKGGFVPDKPYSLEAGGDRIDLRGDWKYKVGQVFEPRQRPGNGGAFFSAQDEPTGLYNTMVAPAIDYGVKGFLWYQGEANTGKPGEYGELLSALIRDWRAKWGEGELPFIYAQLPNFMEVQYSPSESQWAELREQQLETLSLPNTGMAVAIDAGEWNDIHPLDKKDVGERLAFLAEKIAYGDTSKVASGPLYRSATVEGNKIVISFSSIGSGLMVKGGGDLEQFAIAGADKKYVWANARIDGAKVIVWNDEITQPLYVRYAWADNPAGANLYNAEGLPASPFSTDRKIKTEMRDIE